MLMSKCAENWNSNHDMSFREN